jgi:hypothetical protein
MKAASATARSLSDLRTIHTLCYAEMIRLKNPCKGWKHNLKVVSPVTSIALGSIAFFYQRNFKENKCPYYQEI